MKYLAKTNLSRRKSLMIILILCYLSAVTQAQISVVQFMKVQPGQTATYLEVEKAWSALHQKSVDSGLMLVWSLHEKMFHGANDEYDYITVNVYPDWATYEKGYPEGYFNQLGDDVMEKTGASRKIVRTEVYTLTTTADNSKPAKFNNIVFMKVDQGNSAVYEDLEKKYYKTFHENLITSGGMNSWSIYQRVVPSGFGLEFNYVAANGYESLSQQSEITMETYESAWNKASESSTDENIGKLTGESRTMVTSEMWRTVMAVVAEQ